ncbi:FecR domain-containing protein [Deltaproteobacteria bacterium TL4]
MKFYKFVTLIILGLSLAPHLSLAEQQQYGQLRLDKGLLILVRLGHVSRYEAPQTGIRIDVHDYLRTGPQSRASLKIDQNQSTIDFGGNAILQIKPWKVDKTTGFVRLLIGKILAATAKIKNNKPLNILTTSANVGVKGSVAKIEANSEAMSLANLEGTMGLKKREARQLTLIQPGMIGIAKDDGKATAYAVVNENFNRPKPSKKSKEDDSKETPQGESKSQEMKASQAGKETAKTTETPGAQTSTEQEVVVKEPAPTEEAETADFEENLDTQDIKIPEAPSGIGNEEFLAIQNNNVNLSEATVIAQVSEGSEEEKMQTDDQEEEGSKEEEGVKDEKTQEDSEKIQADDQGEETQEEDTQEGDTQEDDVREDDVEDKGTIEEKEEEPFDQFENAEEPQKAEELELSQEPETPITEDTSVIEAPIIEPQDVNLDDIVKSVEDQVDQGTSGQTDIKARVKINIEK